MSARSIRALIRAHVEDELPPHLRRARVEGHALAELDAHARSCMLAFLEGRAGLGWRGCSLLQDCHLALSEVVESLALSATPEPYLARAHRITGLILHDRCAALAKRKRRRMWWQMGAPAG